jgi:hypothetical protein
LWREAEQQLPFPLELRRDNVRNSLIVLQVFFLPRFRAPVKKSKEKENINVAFDGAFL